MIERTDARTTIWTGRLEVDLSNGPGQHVGTVDVVIRIDTLTLWYGNRTLAVLRAALQGDRDSCERFPAAASGQLSTVDHFRRLAVLAPAASRTGPNPVEHRHL
jgi:hypothetical protein